MKTNAYTASFHNGQWEIRNAKGDLILTARTETKALELIDLLNEA